MSVVVSTVNFIRLRALNHRQFREFIFELDAEYSDVTYYSEIRWLSRGACLQRFYSLLDEIKLFVEMKDHHVPELFDELWLQDFAFLVDITTHLNELNTKLQGKDQLVTHLYEHIEAFQVKLRLWEKQLHENKSDHFHRLRKLTGISTNLNRYAEEITTLRAEF